MAELVLVPFDPAVAMSRISHQVGQAGGVASFVGYVRSGDNQVSSLFLEHYAGFTETIMDEIEHTARTQFGLIETLVIHRAGLMRPGDAIVMVVAVATHRKPAIKAMDYMMDRLKTDAPFWKKETGPMGATWIEPTEDDYAKRADWETTP
jgi:molybdopterin synthase catalytic subunit